MAAVLHGAQLSLPYSVATIAGGTFVGDGGPATGASLRDAEGICVDAAGNIYIADAGDNRVRLVAPSGVISTFAGTGVPGPLNLPYGIAADASGNVYVADLGNNRIQKIAPDGSAKTVLDHLLSPRNVILDAAGNLYFSEFAGQRVRKIAPDGTVTVIAGTGVAGSDGDGGLASQARLNYPAGLALDAAGNLYIADSGNNKIRKISSGRIATVLGTGIAGSGAANQLSTPTSVAVDAAGNLYVADSGNQRIRKLTPFGVILTIPGAARDLALDSSGNLLAANGAHAARVLASGAITEIAGDGAYFFRGDGGPATQAHLNGPSGLALDADGNLWVADTANGRIREVSSSGQISTAAAPPQLTSPLGLSLDSSGNLFIADPAAYRIRELLNSQSAIVSAVGDGAPGSTGDGFPAGVSSLSAPNGVAAGPGGVLFFSDTGNNRIRRVYGSGIVVTVAGNGYSGFNGDGAGQGAELNAPTGICLDGAGALYIADTLNNRVRKLTPDGSLSTVAGPAQLKSPRGVAVDSAGNLWIADSGNQRVVVLPPGGALTVVADRLQTPVGLAVDNRSGSVYVADAVSNLVLMLTPGPAALTEAPTPVTVVNAATLAAGPVAPGSLISIFGSALASAQVLFDGQAAAPVMAQDTQINVQVPLAATGAFQVTSGKLSLLSSTLAIAPSAPGVFTGSGGAGPVLAANQDGSLNSSANPAPQGSIVVFYATGLGGLPATVSIGGADAQVLFAGDAPGLIGISQINAQLPPLLAAGTLPLLIQAGSTQSQSGVTLAVR